jgi:hypothetical protein
MFLVDVFLKIVLRNEIDYYDCCMNISARCQKGKGTKSAKDVKSHIFFIVYNHDTLCMELLPSNETAMDRYRSVFAL